MSWRYTGRAKVSARSPKAFGVCDRCGFWYNREDLRWQFDWRGMRLMNLRLLVCDRCLDKPFEHYRPILVPPDPLPVRNARPDLYAPFMPYILIDAAGEELTDTNGAYMTATSVSVTVPTLSNAGNTVSGVSSAQYVDQYYIEAPEGGPVMLVPD